MTLLFTMCRRVAGALLLPLLLPVLLVTGAYGQTPAMSVQFTVTGPFDGASAGTGLIAGIDAAASTGFDGGYDALAFRMGPVQAWFVHPSEPEAGRYYKHDIRSGSTPEVWSLEVHTPYNTITGGLTSDTPVTLSWKPPVNTGGVCAVRSMTLVDANGVSHNLATEQQIVMPPSAVPGIYTAELTIGSALSSGAIPLAPDPPLSPSQGRRGVILVWTPLASGVMGYHVERIDSPTDPAARTVTRITSAALTEPRFIDRSVVGQTSTVAYRIVAVSGAGCESAPSAELLLLP